MNAPYSLAAVLVLGLLCAPQGQRPRFVGTTAAVRLEVSVFNEHGVVRGLKPADFEVSDRGVVQNIAVEEVSDLLLDIVAVAPPVESLEGAQIRLFEDALRALVQEVTADDRFGLVLAGLPPTRLRALEKGPISFEPGIFRGTQETTVLDAVVAALGEFTPSERRKILLVVTTGFDRLSGVTHHMLASLSRRTKPQIIFVGAAPSLMVGVVGRAVPSPGSRYRPNLEWSPQFENRFPPPGLRELASETGGQVVDLIGRDPKKAMPELVARLRRGYVVSYPATGSKGWHPVTVRVKRQGVTVVTRAGYFVE
jgi:hypothetical protein